VARILIVGGGCRGRRFAAEMLQRGHAVRAVTRTEAGRKAIEAVGAECWIGTPDRLATLRGALENVTIACWLLGSATGAREQVDALHGSRLEFFLTQTIDTTVRGFLYEGSATSVAAELVGRGESIVRSMGARNAIPVAVLHADPDAPEAWLAEARTAVDTLLAGS
jgi:putative NADH-flavin reductase